MLSRNILNWLVLFLTIVTVIRSEHYQIVLVDSTDLCNGYRNVTCFTLEQLVQTDLLSGGVNLTLSFLPGDHVLTEQLLIRNFRHVHITSQSKSTAVIRFYSNGVIRFFSTTELSIERLGFINGANVGPRNSHRDLTIDSAHNVYINDCYFMNFFVLLNQVETHLVKIANTQIVTIKSTLFMNNTGRAMHVEAIDVYITNSDFTRNDGGAVYIESNNSLINNTEFNYNSAWSGGAVELVSGTVVITSCNFTNNEASLYGGAISIYSSSVSISNSILTNNSANNDGGAIAFSSGRSVSISNSTLTRNINSTDEIVGAINVDSGRVFISGSTLTNNSADKRGGAIYAHSGSVSISNSELTSNRANIGGGAISVDSSSMSISNSTLTNNRADYGGAFYVTSSSLSISDNTLTNNSAVYIGGAISVGSGSVSISNSKLINNSANTGGMLSVYSSSASISDSTLANNRAAEYGGAISVYSSSVFISDSKLTNNRADYGGGAISVGFSCSVSISESTLTSNRADYGGAITVFSSSVFISDSKLINNSANTGGMLSVYSSSVSISESTLTSNRADYGGAISVDSSNMSISNSTLTNNRADYGGVLYVTSSSLTSSLTISDNTLTNNSAVYIGGAISIGSGSVSISNSKLTNNSAGYDGGAISVYSGTVCIFISNSTLTNNRADRSGGAIYGNLGSTVSISDSTLKNNTATSGGGIFLRESTLFVNKTIKIYHNTAQNGGGIYTYFSKVEFQSVLPIFRGTNKHSEIVDNIAENGGGIYAVATTIELTQAHVNIDSNTASAKGGGVFLQQSSRLYLFKKHYEDVVEKPQDITLVTLTIKNNSAQHGGGIFVADDTQRSVCGGGVIETDATQTIFKDCFIQTINSYGYTLNIEINHFNTFMTNNTATQSGGDIYGGLLDRCTAIQNAEYNSSSNGFDYTNSTVKSSTELAISSRPVRVMFCNNSQHLTYTRKGHTFRISFMAIDQVGNPVNATIYSSVVTESGVGRLKEGQAKQKVGNQCTELEYSVFSQDSSAQVELYAEGPCINLGISRQIINISFLPCTCPIGLKPIQSDTECKCDCDPDLEQYQIINCSEENGILKLESNNNIWIEFITTNGTGYVVSNCTFDYCVEKPVNISLSSPDKQCAYNRSGVLCGECESGLSIVLATSNCKECSNLYLLLLIPFALVGILLVALILVLNITIATGSIHGLIFYANIVAANRAIFFPKLNNFVTVFISWVNLDLGIETCFYDGMNSQAKVLLQLVFPAYLFLLVFLIIILSKYSDLFAKLLSNRNPVAALGTLVLLSYSKFLRFIVAALQNRVLKYPDGSTKTVWLFDGNVPYFTPNHIPRFVAAAIILIAGGLFTVLLFFGQWFPRCSKVMIWTKNTYYNGFMDVYHAPFTPKHRYWVGLLLFALIAHNLVVAMAPNTSLPVLSSGCIAFGLISLTNRVHKKQLNEYLETFFLFNLGILSIGTSYVVETHQQQETLTILSMSIAFILFVTIISYHFHQFILKKTKTWLKIKQVAKNLTTGVAYKKNREPNNAMEIHLLAANEIDDDDNEGLLAEQIGIVDPQPYTDGAMEEADPDRYMTPPIIRPATRPDQLREPALDVLAPLTTEDYRPAPPPPKFNRRPAVTHTEIGLISNEV
ncbi:uncharacterized protein LOC135336760 [Halichondria panicea]|uniref:uncharacterized protein LOC135336760 n=1 Tax=Halichondria panicea TaxID=6063 RepID=UPI00312B87F1